MASDYTVVVRVRQQFGDAKKDHDEVNVDSEAPFVGVAKDFAFSCPNVDPTQEAVLQFAHRGSTQAPTFPDPQPDGGLVGITAEHPVHINGVELFGGVPGAPFRFTSTPLWSTRLLIIQPGVLRANNVLRFETTNAGTVNSGLDNFVIDNVVVFFKTRGSVVGGGGGVFDPNR